MASLRGNELDVIVTLVDNASKDLTKMSAKFKGLGDNLKKQTEAARGFTKAVGLMAGVAGGLAVREFASFEKQMSTVKAITASTEDEFKKLNDLAKTMGATTAFTAREAAQGMEFLGMAGLSTVQIMDALPGSLQLASAANLDLATAADIATNIMAQYGIEAKNIGRVNDVLAKSATSANTSVMEIAEAMKFLGPVANSMKISLEEGAAAIDVLANNGIKGSMAGQAFSASLLRITKPTNKMAAAMDKAQLTLFNAKGEFIGITKTVNQLETGMADFTDEQKASTIATVFGIQSSKQWLTLLKEGSGEIERYTDLLEKSEGTAKKMAETQLDNLAGSFTLLKSAISGVMITAGGSLSKYLRPAIVGLTDLITNFEEKWSSLNPIMQTSIKLIGGLALALGTLTIAVGLLSFAVTPLLATLSGISAIMGLVLSPIGLLVGAIVALGIAYKTNFGGFADFINSIAIKLKPLFESISNFVKDMVEKISVWLDRVKGPFMQVVNFLLPFVAGFLSTLASFFKGTFENIVIVLQGAWAVIQGVFKIAFGIVAGLMEVFLNLITGNWAGAWIAIKENFMLILEGISGVVIGFTQILLGIFKQFFTTLKSAVSIAMQAVKLTFVTIWTFIVGYVKGIITIIEEVFTDGTKNIAGAWNMAMQTMANVTSGIWSGIKASIAEGINWVIDKINWFIKQANKVIGSVPGATKIKTLGAVAFQKGGIVPGFQTGGIIPGSKTPANHDQIPAMLDPGELVLNRSQQSNLAAQLTSGGGVKQTVIKVNINGNSFFGDDDSFVDKIGNTIVNKFLQNTSINSF